MFLRFLIADGKCTAGVEGSIPVLAHWRLSSLPRYLQSEDEESGRRRSRFRSQADHDSGGKPITHSGAKPISDSGLKAISNRPPAEW
jgi:hypothetical protein